MPGTVNRALLESNYQNAGEIYLDTKTEGAFDVLADAIDDNAGIFLAGGSALVVSDPIDGVTGDNVYEQLAFVAAQVQAIIDDSIPPGSIDNAMIQDGAVSVNKLDTNIKNMVSMGGLF